ncbi:MAG TPA: 4-alpha-glucanotransferase [Candidatus Binatia bacterium]|nr:4-alpha-glucanotransferase [Candidatus Binatia bacterium]
MTIAQLQRVARMRGIQTSYINAAGKEVVASRETLEAILQALGAREGVAPPSTVIVLWDGKLKHIPLRGAARLWLESGEVLSVKDSTLPGCPFGYHTLKTKDGESLVISAPSKSYSDPEIGRTWGVFAPMYALRGGSEGFSDSRSLVDWLHPFGGTVMATLPLLASFASEPSPYSPASRLFWNEFYVDADIPGGRGDLLDYAKVAKLKRTKLQAEAATKFKGSNDHKLNDYAAFRAATEMFGPWGSWPARMRDGELRLGDYDERTKNYYAYAQCRAQEQMDDLLRHCQSKGMKFYLDLPLGVHPDGYDVWRERETFALAMSAGAPPDPFFTKGQDWGFPPMNPHRLRETRYRHALDFLRFQMRHTGLLRVDHVMWLHRLYWIPKGRPASEGAYVRYPAEELYAILCLESHRNKTMLVGENLGTVPPEVNKSMARHHFRETYVLQYEAGPKLRQPPRRSVASLNTHDMPTFEAFLRGLDIDDRFDLGLIKKSNLAREHRQRKKLVAMLKKALAAKGDLLQAALKGVARSDAEIVLVNIEDLWRETLPQNVPGTSSERPNWRRKFRYSIEQLSSNRQVRRLLQCVADARAQSRPTGFSGRVRRKRANARELR